MGVKQLATKMVGYAANIPGTKASKARMRKVVLAMVRQIEIETRDESGCEAGTPHLGDIPCLFGTLTSQRYQWDDLLRYLAEVDGIPDRAALTASQKRQLVNKYPLLTAFYCAMRLELLLKTVVVPIFGALRKLAVQL